MGKALHSSNASIRGVGAGDCRELKTSKGYTERKKKLFGKLIHTKAKTKIKQKQNQKQVSSFVRFSFRHSLYYDTSHPPEPLPSPSPPISLFTLHKSYYYVDHIQN